MGSLLGARRVLVQKSVLVTCSVSTKLRHNASLLHASAYTHIYLYFEQTHSIPPCLLHHWLGKRNTNNAQNGQGTSLSTSRPAPSNVRMHRSPLRLLPTTLPLAPTAHSRMPRPLQKVLSDLELLLLNSRLQKNGLSHGPSRQNPTFSSSRREGGIEAHHV